MDELDAVFVDSYLQFIRADADHRASQRHEAQRRQDREARHHKYDHRHL